MLVAILLALIPLAGVRKFYWPAPLPVVNAESDAELYTGTIQLAPSRANRCRRLAFDNRRWEPQELDAVPCGLAPELEEAAASLPSNLDLVREGFRRR